MTASQNDSASCLHSASEDVFANSAIQARRQVLFREDMVVLLLELAHELLLLAAIPSQDFVQMMAGVLAQLLWINLELWRARCQNSATSAVQGWGRWPQGREGGMRVQRELASR